MRRVRFYYDVVCPYSYMEGFTVEEIQDAGTVEIEWLPFELRPAPRPLLEVRGDHLRTDWTDNVYRLAQGRGIEIHLPRYQPRSTLPLAACLWAGEQGALRPFKHALYEAFFCEGEDIATDREIARDYAGPGSAGVVSTVSVTPLTRNGFDWADAAVGAGFVAGLALLVAAGLLALRRRRTLAHA